MTNKTTDTTLLFVEIVFILLTTQDTTRTTSRPFDETTYMYFALSLEIPLTLFTLQKALWGIGINKQALWYPGRLLSASPLPSEKTSTGQSIITNSQVIDYQKTHCVHWGCVNSNKHCHLAASRIPDKGFYRKRTKYWWFRVVIWFLWTMSSDIK